MKRTKVIQDRPMVKAPWGAKKDLPRALAMRALETCQRGNKAHCIHSNMVRAFAEHQGRSLRFVQTFKGEVHWSEQVDGRWCRFKAALSADYAKIIDGFDHDAKHFRAPTKCPMGPVRFAGYSQVNLVDPAVARERKARMNARIKDGSLVPRSIKRERQLPYVEAQNGTPTDARCSGPGNLVA